MGNLALQIPVALRQNKMTISLLVLTVIAFGFVCQKLLRERKELLARCATLEHKIAQQSRDAMHHDLLRWLHSLPHLAYESEISVEVKFVTDLVRFLGYSPNDYKLRVPIPITAGRQVISTEADWVLNRSAGKLVIEAKKGNQNLDHEVVEQARSYALAIKATHYIVTNGRSIHVFKLALHHDEKIFSENVDRLSERWDALKSLIGK